LLLLLLFLRGLLSALLCHSPLLLLPDRVRKACTGCQWLL
jgi:hypothetical protein